MQPLRILMDPSSPIGTEETRPRQRRPWRWLWSRLARLQPVAAPARPLRLLFLDDDSLRATMFLQDHPQAVWVTTVAECVARLEEAWDEVHLDHDLGGKTFVDSDAEDCGMEVIRWLCKEPRVHLKETRFFAHTHNAAAGLLMVLQMRGCDYAAEFRPFGLDLAQVLAPDEPPSAPEATSPPRPPGPLPRRWFGWIASSWRGVWRVGRG